MKIPPPNFRPVPLGSKGPSKFYRSSLIDEEYHEGFQWLTETIGIKTYIDLRIEKEFSNVSLMDEYFIKRKPSEITLEQLAKDSAQPNKRYRYHIPLIVISSESIHRSSLVEYYCQMLDECQDLIRILFSVMLNEKSFPMIITCKVGKDRTGVVAALAMQLVGISDELIISEYVLSEENYFYLKEKIGKFYGNCHDDNWHSFPQTMEKFLTYLKEKYGGAERYLRLCGLTERQIEQIKINLSS